MDPPQRARNPSRHGLDLADPRDRFEWSAALIRPDHPSRYGKPRFVAARDVDGDLHTLVFQLLGTEATSLISFPPASNKERHAQGDKG
nr:BrnT family toxin [Methylobacterium sp.]